MIYACIEHMFAGGADEKLHAGPLLVYDGRVSSLDDGAPTPRTGGPDFVRDPRASRAATLAARSPVSMLPSWAAKCLCVVADGNGDLDSKLDLTNREQSVGEIACHSGASFDLVHANTRSHAMRRERYKGTSILGRVRATPLDRPSPMARGVRPRVRTPLQPPGEGTGGASGAAAPFGEAGVSVGPLACSKRFSIARLSINSPGFAGGVAPDTRTSKECPSGFSVVGATSDAMGRLRQGHAADQHIGDPAPGDETELARDRGPAQIGLQKQHARAHARVCRCLLASG